MRSSLLLRASALAGAALALGSFNLLADDAPASDTSKAPVTGTYAYGSSAVSLGASTLGASLQVTTQLAENYNGRVMANYLNWTHDGSYGSLSYAGKLKLSTGMVVVDWYPWQGPVRFSLGVLAGSNELTLRAKPGASGGYVINGNAYTASQVGSLTGKAGFNNLAPYAGVGFGNPITSNGRWSVNLDLGAVYLGQPKVNLVATGPSSGSSLLTADLAAEQLNAQQGLNNLKVYPVVAVYLSYRF